MAKITVANPPRRSPYLENMLLYHYDASWGSADTKNTANARHVQRVSNRQNMTLTNNALSSTTVAGMNRRLVGTGGPYTAGTKAVVVIGPSCFVNTLGWYDLTVSQQRTAVKESIRSLLAAASASARTEAATFTETGTWATNGDAGLSNGSSRYTTTLNDHTDASITVNSTGRLDVGVIGQDDTALGLNAANITISVDGSQVATYSGSNKHKKIAASNNDQNFVPNVVHLSGLIAGARTISIKHNGGTGTSYCYADVIYTRSTTPSPIVILLPPTMNWSALNSTYGRTGTEADRATLASDIADVISVGGFTNVTTVDIQAAGFNYATMIGDDNLHPNDRGHQFMADVLESAMRQAVPDWSLGVHTQV